jgi:hypothetical protein
MVVKDRRMMYVQVQVTNSWGQENSEWDKGVTNLNVAISNTKRLPPKIQQLKLPGTGLAHQLFEIIITLTPLSTAAKLSGSIHSI